MTPLSLQAPTHARTITADEVRGAQTNEQLVESARQLEGVFVGMLFDEMAKTVDNEDSLFGESPGSDMYQSWFRHEVAKQWTDSGGTGLGDSIAHSLGATVPQKTAGAAPLPVSGRITSGYGERVHPVSGERHVHHGIDIAAPVGTPIKVPYSGRVKRVGTDGPMGNHVVVAHPNGYESVYAHASEILVQPGQMVSPQDIIARSGNTGRTTGPHLHFSLLKDGKPVNPMRWLDPRSAVSVR